MIPIPTSRLQKPNIFASKPRTKSNTGTDKTKQPLAKPQPSQTKTTRSTKPQVNSVSSRTFKRASPLKSHSKQKPKPEEIPLMKIHKIGSKGPVVILERQPLIPAEIDSNIGAELDEGRFPNSTLSAVDPGEIEKNLGPENALFLGFYGLKKISSGAHVDKNKRELINDPRMSGIHPGLAPEHLRLLSNAAGKDYNAQKKLLADTQKDLDNAIKRGGDHRTLLNSKVDEWSRQGSK